LTELANHRLLAIGASAPQPEPARSVTENMKLRPTIAYAGIVLTVLMIGLIASLIVYHHLRLSHPLEGSPVAVVVFLGSPLFLFFQITATVGTWKLDAHGTLRIALIAVNSIGIAVWALLSLLLLFFWIIGPIGNPG